MPWNFHVTKRMMPGDRGAEIALGDWVRLVEADPDMSLGASEFVRSKVAPLSAAQWYRHSETSAPIVFEWLAGNVSVARPDKETLDKLHAIAAALGAHVEDDDGGWYDARGHFLGHLAAG